MTQQLSVFSLNRDAYPDMLDAAVEAAQERVDGDKQTLQQFFHNVPVDSGSFKLATWGSELGLMQRNEDEDDLPVDAPAPGPNKTFTLLNRRKLVQITETFATQDRQGVAIRMAGGLGMSMSRTKEYQAEKIFANAFSGTAGADGSPLCANSHSADHPRGSARDNLSTGALTVSTWHALRLLSTTQKNNRGFPNPGGIDTLVIPPALERKAEELVKSKQDPETGLNTEMVLTSFKIVVSPYLASTTAYFGFNSAIKGMQRGMYQMSLIDANIKDAKPSDNPDIIWAKRAKMVNVFDFSTAIDYVYGSAGT